MNSLIIVLNLLIVFDSICIEAESINENLNLTVKDQFLNVSTFNSIQQGGTDQVFNESTHLLLDDKSRNDSIEINVKLLDRNTSAVDTNVTQTSEHNMTIKSKSKNRRSAHKGGVFGYFAEDGNFTYCPEPKSKKNKKLTKEEINETDTELWKCVEFDEEELKRKFNRKIQSNNGFNGVFGYFYYGKFIRCSAPKELDQDPKKSDTKYIPYHLNYDSKCKYFDRDPGETFDAIPRQERFMSNNSIKLGLSVLASSVVLIKIIFMF